MPKAPEGAKAGEIGWSATGDESKCHFQSLVIRRFTFAVPAPVPVPLSINEPVSVDVDSITKPSEPSRFAVPSTVRFWLGLIVSMAPDLITKLFDIVLLLCAQICK